MADRLSKLNNTIQSFISTAMRESEEALCRVSSEAVLINAPGGSGEEMAALAAVDELLVQWVAEMLIVYEGMKRKGGLTKAAIRSGINRLYDAATALPKDRPAFGMFWVNYRREIEKCRAASLAKAENHFRREAMSTPTRFEKLVGWRLKGLRPR